MTNAILRGKPDAGNPHVRFDEGEVASVKPRRGSLLYSFKNLLLCLTAAFAFAVRGEIGVSGDTTGATDTAAIQSALDAAKTGGGTVTLGSGTFYINTQLTVDGAVTLQGQGWDKTTIKPASGKSISCVKVVDGTISWCTITGNSGSCGGGVCFSGGKGRIDHSNVSNNTGSGAGGGIGMTGLAGDVVIDTCLVYGNASTSGSGGGVAVVTGSGKSVTTPSSRCCANQGSLRG